MKPGDMVVLHWDLLRPVMRRRGYVFMWTTTDGDERCGRITRVDTALVVSFLSNVANDELNVFVVANGRMGWTDSDMLRVVD